MRGISLVIVAVALAGSLLGTAVGKEYTLTDGSTIIGDVSSFDDGGIVFRLQRGGFSQRISWSKLSQESLKEMADQPKLKPMVEPFIEIPPEKQVKPVPKQVVLADVPRVERPMGRPTFFSSFTTPVGLAVLGVLYLGNIFAAYQIAAFRNRPVPVVCGLSAVLPLLGPLIFLASPTVGEPGAEESAEEMLEEAPEGAGPGLASKTGPLRVTSKKIGTPPKAPTGLRVAAQQKAAATNTGPRIFTRGEYTFNRRFIETQFSGFFRVVPTEAEKDFVLVVKTPKNEYLGKRITRISAHEMFLQLLQAGGKEMNIPFGEIAAIEIRHKDDIE